MYVKFPKENFFEACETTYGGYHYIKSCRNQFNGLVICTRYSYWNISCSNGSFTLLHCPTYARRFHRQMSSSDIQFLIWCAYTHDLGKYTDRKIYGRRDYESFLSMNHV